MKPILVCLVDLHNWGKLERAEELYNYNNVNGGAQWELAASASSLLFNKIKCVNSLINVLLLV